MSATYHNIEFSMMQVRENEISLRRQSGGTAKLRTLEGTSVHILHHQIGVRAAFTMMMR